MRDLLPHLRLLTLSPEADDDVLPSFLTTEEQLHVLHFHMFGSIKSNTPENLNTNTAKRTKPTEYCEMLIPDEAVSPDLEYLTGHDIYYWSMEKCHFLQNTVSLCSNTDLYLTSFECVGSFPKSKDCRLKFDETTDSFEVQPKYNAAPEDFWETSVKNVRPFYKNVDIVRSVKTKFGYQKILKCAQLLPKGVEVNLQVTLTNNEKGSERCSRFIRNGTVKQPLNSGLVTDFDYLEVESFNGNQNSNTPYFLKNIRYVKKCDI